MTALDITLSYSKTNNQEEALKQQKRVEKNQQEFMAGVRAGLALYSTYSILTWICQAQPSWAKDLQPRPQQQQQGSTPTPNKLNEAQKGVFVGSATGICGLAFQTSNFWLGVACVGLLIIGSKVVGAPSPSPSP